MRRQAFPLQNIGEIVLRSALPLLRRLLHRQSQMTAARGAAPPPPPPPPQKSAKASGAATAIRSCALLLVAALRLSTSPSGAEVENSLLKNPTSVDFFATKKNDLRSGGDGSGTTALGSSSAAAAVEEEDLDATLPPKKLAEGWVVGRLRAVMEERRGGDALLVEAAAWATLRVLQTVVMGPLRASMAPRVAEAFLRVLLAGLVRACILFVLTLLLVSLLFGFLSLFFLACQVSPPIFCVCDHHPLPTTLRRILPRLRSSRFFLGSGGSTAQAATPKHQWPSLHAGQQEVAAGSALALRLAPPSPTAGLAPHILAAAERVPQPRQRLALLVDVFFLLLVRPGRAGRAPSIGGGGADGRNGRREGEGGSGGGRRGAGHPGEGARMLVSVLEEEWFAQLVSDSPGSGRARRLLFREEAVAALTTACAQVRKSEKDNHRREHTHAHTHTHTERE